MATRPETVRRRTQDIRDVLDAIDQRYDTAWRQARPPSRRPDETGIRGGASYTDPVGQAAVLLDDLLESVAAALLAMRDGAYREARRLEEWAPAKKWPTHRRCDAQGCARPHHAKGLCQLHYRRELERASA